MAWISRLSRGRGPLRRSAIESAVWGAKVARRLSTPSEYAARHPCSSSKGGEGTGPCRYTRPYEKVPADIRNLPIFEGATT